MGKIRLRTNSATEVRRTISRVINMVANGEMDSKTGNTIIVGCNAVLSSIRTDEQKRRIDELERLIRESEEGEGRIESLERRFNRLQRCEIEDMFDVELNIYGYDYAVEEYGKEYVDRRMKGGKESG